MARLKDQTQAIRDAASRLSDDLFDDDSQVKALRTQIAAAETRHREAVERLQRFDTRAIETEIAELAERIEEHRQALPATAYDDLAAGDAELTNTIEARENIRRMVWRREGLEGALQHYRTAGIESGLRRQVANAADEINTAQMRLAERIEHLKVESARRAA